MANNIRSISIGLIQIQTGYGLPTHIATIGTIFIDLNTGTQYVNKNGIALWVTNSTGGFTLTQNQYNAITGATTPSSSNVFATIADIVASTFTGGTVTGSTVFTNGLNANTISATTYYNLPLDIYVTGGTYNTSTGIATFTNNTGGTFTLSGFKTNDIFVTGGTYANGTTTFTNNTGGTFSVTGYKTDDIFVTGATYNNNTFTFTNNTGGTFTVSGFTSGMTDTTVSSFSYNDANKFTIVDSTGGTFNASINIMTGLTINSNDTNPALTVTQTGSGYAVLIEDSSSPDSTPVIVDSNGNVGIGVVPTQKFQVQNNAASTTVGLFKNTTGSTMLFIDSAGPTNYSSVRFLTGGTRTWELGTDGANVGNFYIFSQNANSGSGSRILNITDSGFVGIGRVNPQFNLDVNGNARVSSGLTATTISATTYQNLPIDIRVTGGSYNATTGIATFTNNTGGTFTVSGLFTGSTEVFVTGGTYNNNTFTYTNNTGGTFSVLFNTVTGLTVNGNLVSNTISATTYQNLPIDVFVTGGTYNNSNGTATFTNNTGGTFNVSGFFKSSDDIYTTGLTFNPSSYDLTITRNDGNSFTQNLAILATDMTITGGSYNANTGIATFTNNTGGTFTVSGFLTGQTDTYVTGGTYNSSNGIATFTNTAGNTFTVSGFNLKYYAEYSSAPSASPIATGLSSIAIGDGAEAKSPNMLAFGSSAGNGTNTNVYSSVFIGQNAGRNATNAYYSYFIGQNTGVNATSADNAVFIGLGAGNNSTNGLRSVFIGANAGGDGTNASVSNFIGYQAGYRATNASESQFLGNGAGSYASNASNSNFLGADAGFYASGASNSNFFGYNSGWKAYNASNSNFMGQLAGYQASAATYSNLFGYQAGRQFTNNNIGSNNIIIGTNISLPSGATNSLNIGGVLFGTNTYSTTTGNPSIIANSNGRIGINVVNPRTALEVSGGTIINGTLTATTISATTYLGLPIDVTVTGGTYNSSTGSATFTNNTGGTFSVNGFFTGATDVFTTGATYSAGTAVFTNNTGGTFNLTGLYTGLTNIGNVLFVSVNGNDSTAIKGSLDKPYKSLYGAKTASTSGDTIVVLPQTIVYDNRDTTGNQWNSRISEINLWKHGIRWFFMAGTRIEIYNQTVTGSQINLFNPSNTSYEECFVHGHLDYFQSSTGVNTSNGHTRFFNDTSLFPKTFIAELNTITNYSTEFSNISHNSGVATSGTTVIIRAEAEYLYPSNGQSGSGSQYFVGGVVNGTTNDSTLIFTSEVKNRYVNTSRPYPFYVRGALKGSKINFLGESLFKFGDFQIMLVGYGAQDVNYEIKNTYYSSGYTPFNYYGAILGTFQANNGRYEFKGNFYDGGSDTTSTFSLFHISNTSYNNTINIYGDLNTNTTSGNGRTIFDLNYYSSPTNVYGNTINMYGNINYLGTGSTSNQLVKMPQNSGGSGNTVNIYGNITGTLGGTVAELYYNNSVNIFKSNIQSSSNGFGLFNNSTSTLSTFRLNNSYLSFSSNTNSSNGNYVKALINNSTLINQSSGTILYNGNNFGSLQVVNTLLFSTSGYCINYSGTSNVNSNNTTVNTIYNITNLMGDISTNTDLIN